MNPTSEGAFRSGCLAGERAIAGGWHQHASGASKGVFSLDDAPSEDLTSWNVYLVNSDDQPARVRRLRGVRQVATPCRHAR